MRSLVLPLLKALLLLAACAVIVGALCVLAGPFVLLLVAGIGICELFDIELWNRGKGSTDEQGPVDGPQG